MAEHWRARLARFVGGQHLPASVTARIDDSPGWRSFGTELDRNWAELYQLQTDALTAWRTNPLARRIVNLCTDYVIGDGITLDAAYPPLGSFITRFWQTNNLATRLPEMCSELTRAGELFPTLHFAADGAAHLRFIPAINVDQVRWQLGDYETETEYHETTPGDLTGVWWKSPAHPAADLSPMLCLHYAINRPVGCVRGESDLAPILIWLKRYSGWLEDRARLNWAARVFLWFVTVPANRVEDKKNQYRSTPEPGSVIVKDSGETWEMQTPAIQARDASVDGRAMRYMIGAGAGVPLHMLGEGENTNLATAQAMEDPTLRGYRRRQLYVCHVLKDLITVAYNRWLTFGNRDRRPATADMITVTVPEISRADNGALATAGREIVAMLAALRAELRTANIEPTETLNRKTLELAFRFAGEVLTDDEITNLLGDTS